MTFDPLFIGFLDLIDLWGNLPEFEDAAKQKFESIKLKQKSSKLFCFDFWDAFFVLILRHLCWN
jgi:hypothetical protein